MVGRAIHFSLQGVVGKVAAQLDKILLFQFAGPILLAELWLAQNIERQVTHLYKSAHGVVLPKVSGNTIPTLKETLPRKVLFLFMGMFPLVLGYMWIMPTIFEVFFPQYASSVIYAQAYGILFLFLPFKVFEEVFVGHGLQRELYRITFVSSVSKLVATLLLVPSLAIWGIIISTTLEQLIRSVATIRYFYKLRV
jgi:O-antigen/teichoic acid export membrane protein